MTETAATKPRRTSRSRMIAPNADDLRALCLEMQSRLEGVVHAMPRAERTRFVTESMPSELLEPSVERAAISLALQCTL